MVYQRATLDRIYRYELKPMEKTHKSEIAQQLIPVRLPGCSLDSALAGILCAVVAILLNIGIETFCEWSG